MSDIAITIEADNDDGEQVNDARAAYLDGEISEQELAERIEAAIVDGAGISDSDDWLPDASLKRTLSGVVNLPAMVPMYGFDRVTQSVDCTISIRRNMVSWVDTDPDPDDHPAESAGGVQVLLNLYSVLLYMLTSLTLLISVPRPLDASMVTPEITALVYGSLACMLLAAASVLAEKPTVQCTDRGVGTHTVRP